MDSPIQAEGTGTVLVIVDEEMVRATTNAILAFLGYNVKMASNGKESVALLERCRAKVNIILLDVNMPVMGGLEALRSIRELDSRIPAIETASEHQED